MMITDEEYKNHNVFSELECYIDCYKNLSWSVFSFSSMGINAICSIDYYVYSSIQGKLESIRIILNDGRINDAYELLKGYYDSVMINVYSNLYLKDNVSIENLIVEKMINWLNGKEPIPEFRIMSNYIRSSNKVAAINKIICADDRYKKIRARCNDGNHYGFASNALQNDSGDRTEDLLQVLNAFCEDARDIFILHLAYSFFLNEHYMAASDYLDLLACGITPEPGSQYWVAPFIQEVLDDIIARHRPDIVKTIKQYASIQLS